MYQLTDFEQKNLSKILKKEKLSAPEFMDKGFSALIFKVTRKKTNFALKMQREKQPRKNMVNREIQGLKLANLIGIGPKLEKFDNDYGFVLMEFIVGDEFYKWLKFNPKKKDLKNVIDQLLAQSEKLDKVNLKHSQLAGKGSNILIRKKEARFEPVIIDFEKCAFRENPKNKEQLNAFLFENKNSHIVKKIAKILK